MRKYVFPGLAIFIVLTVVSTSASAHRLASSSVKSAIISDLTAPHALCLRYGGHLSCSPAIPKVTPVRCTKVYVSTVDSAWASETYAYSHSCHRGAANGIAVVHLKSHHWVVITEGSAFTTCPVRGYPGRGAVPGRVAKDLLGVC